MRGLITGAGSGLGRELALMLAASGVELALHYAHHQAGAEQTAAAARAKGARVELFQADFLSFDAEQFVARVLEKFSALDFLIHNACVFPEPERLKSRHSLGEETSKHWEEVFAVNAKAPFFLTQALLPLLEKGTRPLILILQDESATKPYLSRAAYSLSQAARGAVGDFLRAALPPTLRVERLQLGPLVAPPEMPETERLALSWQGYAAALSAVGQLINDR